MDPVNKPHDTSEQDKKSAAANEDEEFDILGETVMRRLSRYIGYEWVLLGLNLGLTRKELAPVENTNVDRNKKSFFILMTWLEKHATDRWRLRQLISALELCGRKDLSQKIHCAQWSEQNVGVEMPLAFPMLIRVNKVRPKSRRILRTVINDLNPSTCVPVHSLHPTYTQAM
ncbi:uncharacterized protein LOC143470626 [Clavelina lepadiformis]|uniref:uncharacterized protein LOC143470626 n=1 Tax=Clavelina lepadiformis TaxID=159417 RepID=UPI0040426975